MKLKRSIQKGIKLFLMAMLLVSVSGNRVYAAGETMKEKHHVDVLQMESLECSSIDRENTNARTLLYDCTILYSCSEEGLHIEITTASAGMASVLGVKDIVIKQKVWYGWKTIATGSGGEDTGCSLMGLSIDYPNVEVGETYRITCVHYGMVDTYNEVENDTGAFVFTY